MQHRGEIHNSSVNDMFYVAIGYRALHWYPKAAIYLAYVYSNELV